MKQLLLIFLWIFPIFTSSQVICPTGFVLKNGNKCLRLIKNNLKHGEAETDCKYFGGTLANIHNAIDNRAIATLASIQTIWTGLFCFTNSTSDCYWDNASGTAQNYSNFVPGHPQIDGGFGRCVYMKTSNMQWVSAKCDVVGMPFVCEVPVTYSDPCLHNFSGFCYFPSHEFPKKSRHLQYSDAQSYCTSINSSLLSIHAKLENDYVKTLFRDSKVSQTLLGFQGTQWADNSPWDFDYSNPLNGTVANCMVMDVQGVGLWSQVGCEPENYFVCRRRAEGTPMDPQEALGPLRTPMNPQEALGPLRTPYGTPIDPQDPSNCNSTFLFAPNTFTTPNYPENFPAVSYCSYRLTTLAPYRIGLYFPKIFMSFNYIYINDENDQRIANWYYAEQPVSFIAPSNIATVIFQAGNFGNYPASGFTAQVLAV